MSKTALFAAGLITALLLVAPASQAMTIREACRITPTSQAAHEGESVVLEGVASCGTGALFTSGPQKIFMQDATAGIAVFSRTPIIPVSPGDRLRVAGMLTLFG